MVEDDRAEITTVVVGNEVFGGVGALQAACSDTLVLQQCLVQSKQHLQGERETGRQEGCCYFLHPQTRRSLLCTQEEFSMKGEKLKVFLFKKYNMTFNIQ